MDIPRKDVIVIGAGAAGLMAAIEAGKRGRTVTVLDHSTRIGSKILVSGGGRCNFTNTCADYTHYVSLNPHFPKSALARFTPSDFIALLERHGIRYHEKEDGQLFCDRSSAEVSNMLQKECDAVKVEILLGRRITGVRRSHIFTVVTDKGELHGESLVVATGGLSFAGLGASGLGHKIAGQFGLRVTELKPGLVPLTFHKLDQGMFSDLSGVSIDARVSCGNKRFRGSFLFTHDGLSGPSILQASLYWNRGDSIFIDLLPETDVPDLIAANRQSAKEVSSLLSGFLPRRFVKKWCERYAPSKPLSQYSLKEIRLLSHQIHNWEVRPRGTGGYEKAEVTKGGVDTGELSSKTMEARKVPGLFFAGEVIDVAGQLGGYNLQWAWSSGYVAGQYA